MDAIHFRLKVGNSGTSRRHGSLDYRDDRGMNGALKIIVARIFAIIILAIAGGCARKKQPSIMSRSPLADSADEVMYPARFNLTDQGLQRAHVVADTAYSFDQNMRMELDGVHATFYTANGAKTAVLTAQHGTTNTRTNNMLARGSVVVVSEEGRRLTTPELVYNQQRNEVSSDSPFVMTDQNRRLEGIGFRSDPDMKNIRVLRDARGVARGVSTRPSGTRTPIEPKPER
jgi:LPS export ABC transporter protein LptC